MFNEAFLSNLSQASLQRAAGSVGSLGSPLPVKNLAGTIQGAQVTEFWQRQAHGTYSILHGPRVTGSVQGAGVMLHGGQGGGAATCSGGGVFNKTSGGRSQAVGAVTQGGGEKEAGCKPDPLSLPFLSDTQVDGLDKRTAMAELRSRGKPTASSLDIGEQRQKLKDWIRVLQEIKGWGVGLEEGLIRKGLLKPKKRQKI